ncbi:hypothetical protein KCU73_g9895, partial [Aureobasidium melanogenum]
MSSSSEVSILPKLCLVYSPISQIITAPDQLLVREKQKNKTYSSRDSHVVTHRSTNLPFNCLCMAERTGCPVFS